jgi:hypothetical protein
MPIYRILVRRGTAAEWASINPTLADGEIGLEQDTRKLKAGNGSAPWNALPYLPPAAHQSTHAIGGVDPLTPSDIGTLSTTQIESLLDAPGSRMVYVDGNRTDSYAEDGTLYRPYKTMRSALASVPSASSRPEFNDTSKRFYCFSVAPGFYDEESGGALNIPYRPHVVFDLSGGATLKGNYVLTRPSGLLSGAFNIAAALTSGSNTVSVSTTDANYGRLKVGSVLAGTGITAVAPNSTTVITAINGATLTLSNNATATNASATISVDTDELGNAVFAMIGPNNRSGYNNARHSHVGILGTLTITQSGSTTTDASGFTQVHLTRCGVRGVIEFTGSRSDQNQLFCWSHSGFDTLKATGNPAVTFYAADTQNSQAGNALGNIIGNVFLQSINNCYWHAWASVFTTASMGISPGDGTVMPPYNELAATSFTRTSNVATVTLAQNHGQSRDLLADGYWREQYVLINGVSENTSFNTPAFGAKVVAFPAANQVSYENTGPDVSTPVTAAAAKWIKGTFFGNANASGFIQAGPFFLAANEGAIHTHPGWRTNTQPGTGTAYTIGRSSAVTFRYPAIGWTANALYVRNRLLLPGNGYQYRNVTAIGVGRSGASQPTWPTTIGGTVVDGAVTWQCEQLTFPLAFNLGFTGSITTGSNQVVVALGSVLAANFQVGHTITGTGIPANTTITGISSGTLTLSSNATATNAAATLTVSGTPAFIGYNVQQTLELLHDSKNIYHNQIDSGVAGATTVQAAIKTLKTQVDGKPSLVAVPVSATSAGTAGQIAYDTNYVYVCTATNTWARAPLAAW